MSFASINTRCETYLEQLNAHTSEHELQEEGDQHDVSDGFDGHDHALHDVLVDRITESSRSTVVRPYFETLGSIDGTQRTKHTQHTKDLHYGHRSVLDDHGDQRHGDDDDVENVESIASERARMKEQPVGDHLRMTTRRDLPCG